jgi:hypothetical protein
MRDLPSGIIGKCTNHFDERHSRDFDGVKVMRAGHSAPRDLQVLTLSSMDPGLPGRTLPRGSRRTGHQWDRR